MAVSQAEIQSVGASKNPKLRAIPDVEIDKHGKFKYILLKVHDPDKEREFKHIVRGMAKAAYHGMFDFNYLLCTLYSLPVSVLSFDRDHFQVRFCRFGYLLTGKLASNQ